MQNLYSSSGGLSSGFACLHKVARSGREGANHSLNQDRHQSFKPRLMPKDPLIVFRAQEKHRIQRGQSCRKSGQGGIEMKTRRDHGEKRHRRFALYISPFANCKADLYSQHNPIVNAASLSRCCHGISLRQQRHFDHQVHRAGTSQSTGTSR